MTDERDEQEFPETAMASGDGRDLTSEARTFQPAQDVPAAGEGSFTALDPAERGDTGDPETLLERHSALLGAGEPAAEAPESPPFSSSLYPGSSDSTGLTRAGDRVTGIEDAPTEALYDVTGDPSADGDDPPV